MNTRVALVGAGAFGRNHARLLAQMSGIEFVGIYDADPERGTAVAQEFGTKSVASLDEVIASCDAAVVATPTTTHGTIATELLERGIDVLVEKPIAATADEGARLDRLARERGRVLQVGHLERFNPAVQALQGSLTIPLFFEVHRLSVFSPRSLDVDVVLDLMIHDLDIVLTSTGELPNEVRAAGISVLSPLVDIANVRLSFPSGCVANLTASRISTEKVRKLRLFQPGEYISVDYQRQDAIRLAVLPNELSSDELGSNRKNQIGGGPLPVTPGEPLQLELQAFLESVRNRTQPVVTAAQAVAALGVAEAIIAKIEEHTEIVKRTLGARKGTFPQS